MGTFRAWHILSFSLGWRSVSVGCSVQHKSWPVSTAMIMTWLQGVFNGFADVTSTLWIISCKIRNQRQANKYNSTLGAATIYKQHLRFCHNNGSASIPSPVCTALMSCQTNTVSITFVMPGRCFPLANTSERLTRRGWQNWLVSSSSTMQDALSKAITNEGLLGDHTIAQISFADAYKYQPLRQWLYSWTWQWSKDKIGRAWLAGGHAE